MEEELSVASLDENEVRLSVPSRVFILQGRPSLVPSTPLLRQVVENSRV